MPQLQTLTRQPALFSQRCSRMRYFFRGGGPNPLAYDPHVRTPPRFLHNAPTPNFHHPMFTRWEIIMLTNKQTNKHTNKQMPLKHSTFFDTLRRWVLTCNTLPQFYV